MNWENLKASISAVVRANGNNEITGTNLQGILYAIVNSLGANATFAGVAYPDTNPGIPDGIVFYLTQEPGRYVNFGNIVIEEDVAVVSNASGTWAQVGYISKGESYFSDINLLKGLSTVQGYYTSSGTFVENSDFTAIDGYVPVVAGQSYIYSGELYGAMGLLFYDANDFLVDYISISNLTTVVRQETDENSHYRMLHFIVPMYAVKMRIATKNVARGFGLFASYYSIPSEIIKDINTNLDLLFNRAFYKTSLRAGRFYNATTPVGSVIQEGENSGFGNLKLRVKPGMKLFIQAEGNSIAKPYILLDDGGFVLSVCESDTFSSTLTIPEGAYFICLNHLYTINNFIVENIGSLQASSGGVNLIRTQNYDTDDIQGFFNESTIVENTNFSRLIWFNVSNRSYITLKSDNDIESEYWDGLGCESLNSGSSYIYKGDMYGLMCISFFRYSDILDEDVAIDFINFENLESNNLVIAYDYDDNNHINYIHFRIPPETETIGFSTAGPENECALYVGDTVITERNFLEARLTAELASGQVIDLSNYAMPTNFFHVDEEQDNYVRLGFNSDFMCCAVPINVLGKYRLQALGNYAAPPFMIAYRDSSPFNIFSAAYIYADDMANFDNVIDIKAILEDIFGEELSPIMAMQMQGFIYLLVNNSIGPCAIQQVITGSGDSDDSSAPELIIPNEIYITEGDTKGIYFDNILAQNDNAPKYSVTAISAQPSISGKPDDVIDKDALFISTADIATSHTKIPSSTRRTILVYNQAGKIVARMPLHIVPTTSGYAGTHNICCIGDSITEGQNMPYYIEQFMNSKVGQSATLNFVGSKGGTTDMGGKSTMHEGWWGRSYQWLAGMYEDPIQPSPFINPNTNQLDITYYRRQVLGMGENDKINIVSLAMGFNAIDTQGEREDAMDAIIDIIHAFQDDNPYLTNFVIQLPTFPAKGNVLQPLQIDINEKKQSILAFRKMIMQTFDSPLSPYYEKAIIGDMGLSYDRYRAYSRQNTSITPGNSPYYPTEQKEVITDWVHPTAEGTRQMGESIAMTLLRFIHMPKL